MKIRKAVFPVGGLGTRFYPITTVIPKEMIGVMNKPLIHYAFEEALAAGIEQFIFITKHGKNSIEDYFDYMLANSNAFNARNCSFCYIRQSEPLGLGHAVCCARNLIDEPFAVVCADDFISHGKSCIGEMVENYDGSTNMAAVMTVPREDVSKYGILEVEADCDKIVVAKSVEEKPSVENAKSNIAIVGRYILSPGIFDVLGKLKPGMKDEIQLTDALLEMIPRVKLVGFKFDGKRFDCGSKEGLLAAILHEAMGDEKLFCIIKNFCNGELK
jgi:UTP--glucose-1-phosphate uridylyltransferase